MEERFVPTQGGAVQTQDFATLSDNAALADDRILAELIRPAVFSGGAVQKLILPSARSGRSIVNYITGSAVVIPSGAGDARTVIRPFRAIVGIPGLITSIGSLRAWRDLRSVIHHGTQTEANVSLVQHAATSVNHRWDLIYARVDIDQPTADVPRMVKSAAGVVSPQNVSVSVENTITIGVTQGTESGSPSRPAVPSDSGSTYYIPLAYVLLKHPHTLSTEIPHDRIWEIFTPAYLGEATGAQSRGPANGAYSTEGFAQASDPWDPSGGRSKSHLPPSMHGGVSRFFLVPKSLAVGTHLIDNSIDWRNRFVKWHAQSDPFDGPVPVTGTASLQKQGIDNTTAVSSGTHYEILRLVASDHSDSFRANILEAGNACEGSLKANDTTGALEIIVTEAAIPTTCWVWLEATGQWNNLHT